MASDAAAPDIVVLSNVDWDAAWQRHQAFAECWAKAGHRVFFVENTGSREPRLSDAGRIGARLRALIRPAAAAVKNPRPAGVEIVSPLTLPPTRAWLRALNARWLVPRLVARLRTLGLKPRALVFVYPPTDTSLRILDELAEPRVIYDCVENFAGLRPPPPDLARCEAELLSRARAVLATSSTIAAALNARRPGVVELHHGVSEDFFLPPPTERPGKRLAYFGTIWKALDFAAISALAEAGFEVSLIGPVKGVLPRLPPSARREPALPHDLLPERLAQADALLLPYVDDEYNRGVAHAKLYECLATGLPVLASPLPALTARPELSVLSYAASPQDWVKAAHGLDAERAPARREARVAVARAHSRAAAFTRLREIVEGNARGL